MISLWKSLPGLYNVGMLVLFFLTIFTIIGVEFFRELVTEDDSNPRQGIVSFENGGMSFLTVVTCITLEGWTDVLTWVDTVSPSWGNWLYFLALVVLGAFIACDLAMGVLSGKQATAPSWSRCRCCPVFSFCIQHVLCCLFLRLVFLYNVHGHSHTPRRATAICLYTAHCVPRAVLSKEFPTLCVFSVSVCAAQFTLEGEAYQNRADFKRANQRRVRNVALENYREWVVRQHQDHSRCVCMSIACLPRACRKEPHQTSCADTLGPACFISCFVSD